MAIIFGVLVYVWQNSLVKSLSVQLGSVEEQNKNFENQIKELNEDIKKMQATQEMLMEISKWKSVEYKEQNLAFEIPQNWFSAESSGANFTNIYVSFSNLNNVENFASSNLNFFLQLPSVMFSSDITTFDEWVRMGGKGKEFVKNKDLISVKSSKEVLLGGAKAIRKIEERIDGETISYYIKSQFKNNVDIYIRIFYLTNDSEKDTIEDIINTVEFTNINP